MLASSARRGGLSLLHRANSLASANSNSNRRCMSTALNQFTEEENMLRESVKKWAETEVKPLVRQMDKNSKTVRFHSHQKRQIFDFS